MNIICHSKKPQRESHDNRLCARLMDRYGNKVSLGSLYSHTSSSFQLLFCAHTQLNLRTWVVGLISFLFLMLLLISEGRIYTCVPKGQRSVSASVQHRWSWSSLVKETSAKLTSNKTAFAQFWKSEPQNSMFFTVFLSTF